VVTRLCYLKVVVVRRLWVLTLGLGTSRLVEVGMRWAVVAMRRQVVEVRMREVVVNS
jgi:hypothetical protein